MVKDTKKHAEALEKKPASAEGKSASAGATLVERREKAMAKAIAEGTAAGDDAEKMRERIRKAAESVE